MGNLFADYELLAHSGLFDSGYYLQHNPDVAELNLDPLTHYLEQGAVELRNPSAAFDARAYIERCQSRGEQVENPLLHYLKQGTSGELAPAAKVDAELQSIQTTELLIALDHAHVESNGSAVPVVPGPGTITARDQKGASTGTEFRIQVEDALEIDGPAALRRRMSPAEIDLLSRPLIGKTPQPCFSILLGPPISPEGMAGATATVRSLASQVYDKWHLTIISPGSEPQLQEALSWGRNELGDRINFLTSPAAVSRVLTSRPAAHVMVLRPGDELGCDALLQFAVHATLNPEADFFYSDERRHSPASNKTEAFFKPQWSPELLLSMDYLGRAWCARAELLRRAHIRASELVIDDTYHLSLRLTERAAAIHHVSATLLQQAPGTGCDEVSARTALEQALRRRKIAGTVGSGRAKGSFHIQRKLASDSLVSIIIPTCAERGLIRNCLESLRTYTDYPNFEIVCIENIPVDKPEWKQWLRIEADRVIEAHGAFNWARFNNLAVEASRGEFLLFLNDDIEIINPQWLRVLLAEVERPEIGVVGPQLLYPDGRVQHAGMFLAAPGVARHAFRHASEDHPGYFGLALAQREVISVTGACLLTRRETFLSLGRFDESHELINNDVDFCLRVRERGLRVLYTPHAKLIRHELASPPGLPDSYDANKFADRWRSVFATGDPYFHPRLSKERDDYSYEWEPATVQCGGHPVKARDPGDVTPESPEASPNQSAAPAKPASVPSPAYGSAIVPIVETPVEAAVEPEPKVSDSPFPGYIDSFGYSSAAGGWIYNGWIPRPFRTDLCDPVDLVAQYEHSQNAGKAILAFYEREDLEQRSVGVIAYVLTSSRVVGHLQSIVFEFDGLRYQALSGPSTERLLDQALVDRVRSNLIAQAFANRNRTHLLTITARTGYAGHDTLGSLAEPVFLEIDDAIPCPPDGVLLKGWHLAAPGVVRRIRVRSGPLAGELELSKAISVARPDVISAVGQQLGFVDANVGFIAYVPGVVSAGDATYIEVELENDEVGFKNFKVSKRSGIDAIRRILEGLDIRYERTAPTFDDVLGPAIRSINAARLKEPVVTTTVEFGESPELPRCSLIIPLYGRVDFVEYQMALFSRDRDLQDTEIVYVLDDPPKRRELEVLAQSVFERFGIPFRLVLLSKNIGFAPANNRGLQVARGRYVFFLNSDVFPITAGWIARLTTRLAETPDLGVLGAQLLFEDGSIQHEGCFYRRIPEFGHWTFVEHFNKGRRPAAGSGLRYCEAITGACMLMERALALDLGGFDESYVIGDFEDSDLCLRLKACGRRCAVDQDVRLYHLERKSQAAPGQNWRMNLTLYNAWVHERRWSETLRSLTPPP